MEQCVLALGFFDGVHLGHGGLLRRARAVADQLRLPAAALTFDVHPDTLVRGEAVALLSAPDDRAELMRSLYGIDRVHTLHFDRATMNQPWREFVETVLFGRFRAAHVVCGYDFRFGANGEGTPEKLAGACAALGIGCDCVPEIRLEGETVSSTLIRALLERGEMARAVRFLGHPHRLSGTVVGGNRLGRKLGIPTANLPLPRDILAPKFGVYAATAHFDGQSLPAVLNIGVRPTVGGEGVTVEPWILDYSGDLYGHFLRLDLVEFLRPERKFPDLQALRAEVLRNAEQVRALFAKKNM